MIQDRFLANLQTATIRIAIFLVSGIQLIGHIHAYNEYMLTLHSNANKVREKWRASTNPFLSKQ